MLIGYTLSEKRGHEKSAAGYRVFLSHSHKDRWIARQCARLIEDAVKPRASVFFDERDIGADSRFPDSGRTGIASNSSRNELAQRRHLPSWPRAVSEENQHSGDDLLVARLFFERTRHERHKALQLLMVRRKLFDHSDIGTNPELPCSCPSFTVAFSAARRAA